jgi:hypothetical protein
MSYRSTIPLLCCTINEKQLHLTDIQLFTTVVRLSNLYILNTL